MTRIGTRGERTERKGRDHDEMMPTKVKIQSKLERGDGQIQRWQKSDKEALVVLFEEFGSRSFSVEEADECGYLDMAEVKTSATMERLVRCGWFTIEDNQYSVTEAGEVTYNSI